MSSRVPYHYFLSGSLLIQDPVAVRATLLHLYERRINSSNVKLGEKKVKAFNNGDCACIQIRILYEKKSFRSTKAICEL